MKNKSINLQIVLEVLTYLLFAGLMIYLVISENYLRYVTPRTRPYFIFSALVMVIWALFALARVFKPQHRIRSMHCFVLLIPALLLVLPHTSLGISDLSGEYVSGNNFKETQSLSLTPQSTESNDPNAMGYDDNYVVIPENSQYVQDTSQSDPYPGLNEAEKRIDVDPEDFGLWFSQINMDPRKYEGYTISLGGSVFRSDTMDSDTFIPARPMMFCCVADLVPAGLKCTYDKAPELEDNDWIQVEGTLVIRENTVDGFTFNEPIIEVSSVEEIEEIEGFSYPY